MANQQAPDDLACQRFVEIITSYLEGDLDAATTAQVERHLAACPHCDTYLAQMRGTIAALGHVPVATLPAGAKAEILAAFRGMSRESAPG